MFNIKIFLDPGHGGTDPGAVAHIRESQYTLSYALELGRALSILGFDVSYSRTTDVDVPLAQRGASANRFGANFFVSVHFNAGGGHGIETYALSPGGHGEKLASAVQEELINKTGAVNRKVKFANFQVLRDTSMPAILIEGGFVDTSDSQLIQMDDYKHKFVQGATKGICNFTGIAWRDIYAVVAPVPVAPPIIVPPVIPPVVVPVIPIDKNTMIIALLEQAIKLMKG